MSGERTQGEYPRRLAVYPLQAALIDKAIQLLAPGASHLEAAKLFDDRASWCAVRGWRKGWNRPPQWAVDLISSKLLAHGAEYQSTAQALPAVAYPGHTGAAGKQALNRYRAAQAAKKQSAKT